MSEDKLHPSPEETVSPPPEQGAENSPVQGEPGDVVVDFDKINELMAQRRAAARAEVEQRGEDEHTPTPEETLDSPGPEPEHSGDEGAPGGPAKKPDDRETEKTSQEEQGAKQDKKQRRGRPPKSEKSGPEAGDKPSKPRKGRPPKDKAAAGKVQRDKVSQSKPGPEQPSAGGGPGSPPVLEQQEEPKPPRPVENQKIVYLKHSEMHPFHTFRAHPFKVRDDAKMMEMVASIKENGVMTPGLARPEKDGSGYEIIAGHRRSRASELAGLEETPFIVRDMTDHEAVQAMKDSNKQREGMLPSELAALLELEVEDIKHQGTRLKGVAEGDIGKRSVEIVGEAHGMNYKKVMRYLRLNSLVPELLDKVDGVLDENGKRSKGLGFMPAVELSYIRPKNQQLIAVSMDGEQASPSVAQAKRLRELDQKNLLNGDVIDQILSEEKKEVDKVIITTDELNKYFGKEITPRQMKEQIIALLDEWKEKQPPEKKAPEQAAELS